MKIANTTNINDAFKVKRRVRMWRRRKKKVEIVRIVECVESDLIDMKIVIDRLFNVYNINQKAVFVCV